METLKRTVWHYTGEQWDTLEDCCNDLHLNLEDVLAFSKKHHCGNIIAEYIKQHRFIVHGIIFKTLEEVALHYGVPRQQLQRYIAKGYGIDLAAHMIRRKLDTNFFEVKQNATQVHPSHRKRRNPRHT